MAVSDRPRIDRTSAGLHEFLLDGPCGRAGGYTGGTRYRATPGPAGWVLSSPSSTLNVEQAHHLLSYLSGPRMVRITVIAMGAVSFDDRELMEHTIVESSGTDPDAREVWCNWLTTWMLAWLAETPVRIATRRLHVMAADMNAVDLRGSKGLATLATVQLNEVDGHWTSNR